jgi:hypothetical protein
MLLWGLKRHCNLFLIIPFISRNIIKLIGPRLNLISTIILRQSSAMVYVKNVPKSIIRTWIFMMMNSCSGVFTVQIFHGHQKIAKNERNRKYSLSICKYRKNELGRTLSCLQVLGDRHDAHYFNVLWNYYTNVFCTRRASAASFSRLLCRT